MTLSFDNDATDEIERLQARVVELEAAEWHVRHVDTMNDMVLLGLDRDEWKHRAEAAEALLPEAVKAGMLYGAKVNPLVWGYHPCGAIAVPPTGRPYIIDTRMKGRCYSVKGFNPERQFASLDEAKVAAQADYEQRIRTAMDEPDPETIARIVAQVKEDRE